MEWSNTVWVSVFPRGEEYLYTEERNGKKVCIKGTKKIQDCKLLLPPINRGLYDRLTRKRMEAYKNEKYEDLNLSDIFNEVEPYDRSKTASLSFQEISDKFEDNSTARDNWNALTEQLTDGDIIFDINRVEIKDAFLVVGNTLMRFPVCCDSVDYRDTNGNILSDEISESGKYDFTEGDLIDRGYMIHPQTFRIMFVGYP